MRSPPIQPDLHNYPYHEYLLVLKPNASVNEKILQVKEEFSKKFKIVSGNYSNPYIYVGQLFSIENDGKQADKSLEYNSNGLSPVYSKLKRLWKFPKSYRIYKY